MKNRCSVCSAIATDQHHIKTRGSGGSDEEFNLVYLCRWHHTEIHQIGADRMVRKYKRFESILLAKGWIIEEVFGVKKLRRYNEES